MKKFLALLLALITVLTVFALPAMAEDEREEIKYEFVDVTGLDDEIPVDVEDDEPYCPELLEKTIFGKDDRIKIAKPSKFPYSAIAYMIVEAKCGCTWTGTGFMVGNGNTMLTAAHCLVCTKHAQFAKYITLYFGHKSASNYLYKYTGSGTMYVGTKFANGGYTIVKDYGVYKLKTNVGSKTGWFGAKWSLTNAKLKNKVAIISGYRRGVLKRGRGNVNVLDSTHIKYTIDTQPGTSGCPVYTTTNYAYGINIAENNQYNIAHRLTNAVYKLYKK